jgi:hypothetical protein
MVERQIELLRLLGRLKVADAQTLFRSLYDGRFDIRTTYNDLTCMSKQRYIWEAKVSAVIWARRQPQEQPPGRNRTVYGLSRAGHRFLTELCVEPDPRSAELLVHRDTRGAAPNQAELEHDLQVSWWCASVVRGLRLIPWCSSIYLQAAHPVSKGQRVDALLIARFDPYRHRANLDAIPWFDGARCGDHEFELRWALELDNGTQSFRTLVDRFVLHRDMHARGAYQRLFGGEVIPVLIAQIPERAAHLAAEYSRAWPEGWGLISTPDASGARSSPFGPLWGTYVDMNNQYKVPLLSMIVRDPLTLQYGYHPLLPYEAWLRYLDLQRQGRPPQSLYDLEEV